MYSKDFAKMTINKSYNFIAKIAGHQITLRYDSDAEKRELEKVVARVNERVEVLQGRSPKMTTVTLLQLLGLNLARDLLRKEDELDRVNVQMSGVLHDVVGCLDPSLSGVEVVGHGKL